MSVSVRPPMPAPATPVTQPKRQNFQPSARGSLSKIVDTPYLVRDLAPESPRPQAMLQGVKVETDHTLTAFDFGVYEYLQSWSYEHDKNMEQRAYRMPLSTLRRFLGPHTKTTDIIASLEKLAEIKLSYTLAAGSRFVGVQMITSWQEIKGDDAVIGWQWPEPIRELMRDLGVGKYAHIELVPLTTDGMSSRYSAPLYKWLAFEASQRKWKPGQPNTFELKIEPGRLVAEIDYPEDENGKFNIGKLTKFATETFVKDIENVRKFSVTCEPEYEAVRGRKISAYRFTVTINPPAMHNVRVRYDKTQFRRGGKDDPRYQVRSDIWLKASKAFSVEGSPMHGLVHWKILELWLVALQEAIDNKALTPGFETRPYRGESLLMAIEAEGPDYACWGFLSEEVAEPDLLAHLDMLPRHLRSFIASEAESGRRDRVGWKTDRRRKVNKKATEYISSLIESEPVEEPITFETCTKAHIYFSMPVEELERRVFERLSSIKWNGTRTITLVSHYSDESGHDGTYATDIRPTLDQWCTLLNGLSPIKKGTEIYA
ncbi:replication initiation protein [Neorhizobium galegae]|nr:replication initiation protein [Neorhizobium galegae]